jgi:hypothetical protein
LVDALGLLEASTAWTDADRKPMRVGLGLDPYQKSLEALPRSAWEGLPDRLLCSRP